MKLKQFQQKLQEAKITYALFTVDETLNPGFLYFTQVPNLTHCALVIPATGKPELFVSSLDYGRAINESAVKVSLLESPLLPLLKKKFSSSTMGLDFTATPYSMIKKIKKELKNISIKDINSFLQDVRLTKTPEEIALLKKAAAIANKSFLTMINNFHYKTESDLKAALEYEMAKMGATPSFSTIVASGRNASVPHHRTTQEPLHKGFCVIDFGANYRGYCSDCTRTIFIGNPTTKDRQLYNIVLNAKQTALHQAKIGASCSGLDKTARKMLSSTAKYFTHSLGHGIGIEVHESPSLSAKSATKLQKNMVVTIEPGIYIPNKLGIRIEDTILIKSGAPEILTKLPKDLRTFIN
jgi:Xaa-Pro aminopeptidase